MSRKTYSLSAIAVVATATLGFSSIDGAGAFAQAGDQEQVDASAFEPRENVLQDVEIVPEAPQPEFVEQEVVQPLPPQKERAQEQASFQASSLNELVGIIDTSGQLSEQMQCLAGAVYFEARGEPLAGQLAVADVVINRSQDHRFPASYCGVVYQRSQFSFVKGGRMPSIRTGTAAWSRAKAIARIAHDEMWDSKVDGAVYFHAKYVRPSWSRSKTRTATIDTHIFYR